jgi:hypothetical protein
MTDTVTKTLGDYGVEAEKAMANNNTSGLPPIVEEMRAAAPPLPVPQEGEPPPVEPPPPAPVDLGLRGFADALDAAAQANNVVAARKVAEDMKTLEPPTPPPVEPPAQPAA